MKVELALECSGCCNCTTLDYIDEDVKNVNYVVLQFVFAKASEIGWQVGEEILCPVCTGKMTETEFNEKESVEITVKTIE